MLETFLSLISEPVQVNSAVRTHQQNKPVYFQTHKLTLIIVGECMCGVVCCVCVLYLLEDGSVHIREGNWVIISFIIHSQICQKNKKKNQ